MQQRRRWTVTIGAACALATASCTALLDTDGLSERGGESGDRADATVADGGISDGMAESAPSEASVGDSALDAAVPDGDGGPCTLGAQECSGASQIVTCNDAGQWVNAFTCSSGTCAGDACSGTTTAGESCGATGAGLDTCPAGTGSESCCTSLQVPGGSYDRAYTNSGTGATGTANPASISGFRLDKYEVTVGRFRRFVAAWNNGSGYLPTATSGKHTYLNGGSGLSATGGGFETGWLMSDDVNIAPTAANLTCTSGQGTWTSAVGAQENLPINCVNWFEAEAFCIWDGGFLTSEAEWEYASAGGAEERYYPWGDTTPGSNNQYAIYDYDYPNGTGTYIGIGNIAPVGTPPSGAGKWGHVDLAGGVWEWNLDYWDQTSPYINPCTDCANTTMAYARVTRGGSFEAPTMDMLPANRSAVTGSERSEGRGIRCARNP